MSTTLKTATVLHLDFPYSLVEIDLDPDRPIPYFVEEPVKFCESFVVDDGAHAVAAE